MLRLMFEKKGNAVWISHLDLMRLFQRAFKRANLPLTHTQGFNPRPSVSIALPLSVGVESGCEFLDFELDGVNVPYDEICARLNETLVEGIKVLKVYPDGQKIREIAFLHCTLTMEYDNGVPGSAVSQVQELFNKEELLVSKKSKNGITEQNIIPMIRSLSVDRIGEQEIEIDALICCQNPTLNPVQIPLAIEMYLPEMKPDFSRCERIEVFDNNENVFR